MEEGLDERGAMNQLPGVQGSQASPPGDQDHNTARELSLRGAGDTGAGSSANQRRDRVGI